jgi:dCTP deaminase
VILADWQITARCEGGMVTPFDPELVNPASLDVRLGGALLIESAVNDACWRFDQHDDGMVPYPFADHTQENPYLLLPGQFVLAHTVETFNLPDDIAAQFMLKSSRAREGIEHLMAGYADPGFHGVMTLELHNSRQLHPVPIWPGMRIGQMVFTTMAATPQRSYALTGRYNGHSSVQASLG